MGRKSRKKNPTLYKCGLYPCSHGGPTQPTGAKQQSRAVHASPGCGLGLLFIYLLALVLLSLALKHLLQPVLSGDLCLKPALRPLSLLVLVDLTRMVMLMFSTCLRLLLVSDSAVMWPEFAWGSRRY